MKRTLAIACLTLLSCAACQSAHADTFSTFVLDNVTMRGGGTASGTVVIDTTSGVVISEDVMASQGGVFHEFTGPITLQGTVDNVTEWEFPDAVGDQFLLVIPSPATLLVGYTGGLLCSDTNPYPCIEPNNPSLFRDGAFVVGGNTSLAYFISTGSLDPVPEPSSWMLLGSGLAGLSIRAGTRGRRAWRRLRG